MKKPAFISALEADHTALRHAGAAMYKIREPKGSQRVNYDDITLSKQKRNQELAIRLVTQVFTHFPDPSKTESSEELMDYMAEQKYQILSPLKSETFPYDQRTPFARTYYKERARTFFYEFLLPISEAHNRYVTAPANELVTQGNKPESIANLQQQRSGSKSLPSARDIEKALSRSRTGRSPEIASGIDTPSEPIDDNMVETVPAPNDHHSTKSGAPSEGQVDNTSLLTMIGCLLAIIVVLLIILVIRM